MRILLYDLDKIFRFIRKILIFIPELFLCACLICHSRHKPKKARNQSRSSSQEHEPNHFLFVCPPLSFHCSTAIKSTCSFIYFCIPSRVIYIFVFRLIINTIVMWINSFIYIDGCNHQENRQNFIEETWRSI